MLNNEEGVSGSLSRISLARLGWRRGVEDPVEEEQAPTYLNTTTNCPFLVISTDKLSAQYNGEARHGYDVGAIQGNCAAPVRKLLYYFEIYVKDKGQKGNVSIGFTDQHFKMTRQPGWEPNSFGYHGDDGYLYHGNGKAGEPFGPKFTTGDTAGAGINYASQTVFFTKNGKLVGSTPKDVKGPLYPTIGLHSPNEKTDVNFGQRPFVFDIEGMSQLELEDEVEDDLKRATGGFMKDGDSMNKLNRVLQLTGFSDPVYAEAYVTVHQYDIVLDVTVINRTKETLQNLCLELATMGDLKLVERPQNYTLAPESSKQIKANIKVSSTETGVIFGNIVYETTSVLDRNVVVLNDIHIDIMDYISPATCPDVSFRNMWAEFEWENKVAVNTTIQDEKEFLNHIMDSTNMKCLTPLSALDGDCGFLAANLYAKSVFGEDALVNVSIEKQSDGKLSGFIRIRSKTQGIALSLGDKITLKQKG